MANPQIEDGYIRIANELFEALYSAKFSGGQLSIILYIIRRTYGFNKKAAPFTVREISKYTGICAGAVSQSLSWMIENKIIISSKGDSKVRLLGINKNYEEWMCVHSSEHSMFTPVNKSVHSGEQSVHSSEQILLKDNKKTYRETVPPEFLELWNLYPAHKREGLEWMKPECIAEVIENSKRVRDALEQYLAKTPEPYICKAEKFFREKWKAYAPEEEPKKKRGNLQ